MEALEHRIARDLFPASEAASTRFRASQGEEVEAPDAATAATRSIFEITATFLELLGKRATDLIAPPEGQDDEGEVIRKEVHIHENKVGSC